MLPLSNRVLGSGLQSFPLPIPFPHLSTPSVRGKSYYPDKVGERVVMRGKNKNRMREFMMSGDSDEEMLFGRSPYSLASSFAFEDFSASGGGHRGGVDTMTAPAIKPRNDTQEAYLKMLEAPSPPIVIGVGSSGSGKTMLACHIGMKKLIAGDITKLILTRPAVSVDEEHGFLPGTLTDKMDPWLRPIYDVLYQYMSQTKLQKLIAQQVIEICPLAYMRGRTFEHAWIIADEFQNSTPKQMLMLLTRIGHNSKLVITGDPLQFDRGYEHNGLADLVARIQSRPDDITRGDIAITEFKSEDVQRHPVIRKILRIYG